MVHAMLEALKPSNERGGMGSADYCRGLGNHGLLEYVRGAPNMDSSMYV